MFLVKFLFFMLFLFPTAAKADLFSLTLSQGSHSATKGFTSVLDVFDSYNDGKLDTILSGYDTSAAATGILDFRGIRMILDYTGAGSNSTLRFRIDSLGIDKDFGGTGFTQEQAFSAFKEYLKTNKDNLLTRILKESVSNTPYDSVAGNPSSLMSQMADMAFSNPTMTVTERAVVSGQSGGFVLLSPSGGRHKVKGTDGVERDATTLNLPLGYMFKFDNNWALGIDMPLSYVDMDGSKTYAAQLGLSLQIPLYQDKWLLTVSGRAGATASEDSLSGGVLYMASAASRFTQGLGENTAVTLVNMFGIIKDYTLDVKGYEVEYGLKNNVFKNGLELRQKLSEKTALTVFGYDTRYTGSDLYIDSYDEVGFRFTKYFSKDSFFAGVDLTASYTFGDNYKAYNVGLSFLF